MRNKFLQLFAILLSLHAVQSYALPDDQDQPIYISADSASINDNTGITTYKGDVVIKQGSLLIEAIYVEMYRGEEGVEKLIAEGSPAHFRQQSQANDPYSDAWGKHMIYMVNTRKLTIIEQAKVVQNKDTFTGEKIVYDLDRSIVDAFGSAQGDGSTDGTTSSGRVNMVIQPKKNKADK